MRAILLIAFAALLLEGIVRAEEEPILTGSSTSIVAAASKCQTIFTGTVTNPGEENPVLEHASSGPELLGVRVKILQMLRGTIHNEDSLALNINANHIKHETTPQTGETYIFFVYSPDIVLMSNPTTVLKLLPGTKSNILAVKLAIVGQGT